MSNEDRFIELLEDTIRNSLYLEIILLEDRLECGRSYRIKGIDAAAYSIKKIIKSAIRELEKDE